MTGEELAPAVTTLLVRRGGESFAPEFRHLARRTHDPRDRREAALALLAERYYQHARDFSDVLTATFAAGSALAADLEREGRCVLAFAQDSQSYTICLAPWPEAQDATTPAATRPGGTTRCSTRSCRPTFPSWPSRPAGWRQPPSPTRTGRSNDVNLLYVSLRSAIRWREDVRNVTKSSLSNPEKDRVRF